MAFSGTISATAFNANKVVDSAFRRCRLPAQAITAEMQSYALDSLYLWLSSLGNNRVPSWCIEKQIYPIHEGQPLVTLDLGTVGVLNANLRTVQPATPSSTISNATTTTYDLGTATTIATVGIKGSGTAFSFVVQVSDDTLEWTTTASGSMAAVVGARVWVDLSPAKAHQHLRVVGTPALAYDTISLGALPQEIPMGLLNKDDYVSQSNKTFTGRPLTYWFQRTNAQPVLNLWPAPNSDAELRSQLVVWRHRHIMDTPNLRVDIDVPQRWLEAMIDGLGAVIAVETASVDLALVPLLQQRAAMSLEAAWSGDSDGSPTKVNPGIAAYTA